MLRNCVEDVLELCSGCVGEYVVGTIPFSNRQKQQDTNEKPSGYPQRDGIPSQSGLCCANHMGMSHSQVHIACWDH